MLLLTNTFPEKTADKRFGECLQALWSHEVQAGFMSRIEFCLTVSATFWKLLHS